jgi:hypothetical protein
MDDQLSNIETMSPEQAQGEMDRLSTDKEFTSSLLSGSCGPAARHCTAVWGALQRKAFGGAEPTAGDPATDPSAQGEKVVTEKPEIPLAPATPEDYKITRDYSVPDWDVELESEVKQLAHAVDMPNGALEGLILSWNSAVANIRTHGPLTDDQLVAQRDATVAKLQAKYGAGTNEILAKANSVIDSLPDTQRQRAKELLRESGLGNSPYLIEQLAMLADRRK